MRVDLREHLGKITTFLILAGFLFYLRIEFLLRNTTQAGIKVSVLDVFDASFGKYVMTLVLTPFFVFILLNILSFYNNGNFVIKYKSRTSLWNSIFSRVLCYSTMFVFSLVVFNLILGMIRIDQFTAWKEKEGILYQVALSLSKTNPELRSIETWGNNVPYYNPILIVSLYSLFAILGFAVITLITYIVILLTKKKIIGYIVMLLLITIDTYGKVSIVFNQIIISYKDILFLRPLFWDLIYLVSLLVFLYFIGETVIKKIDFRPSK